MDDLQLTICIELVTIATTQTLHLMLKCPVGRAYTNHPTWVNIPLWYGNFSYRATKICYDGETVWKIIDEATHLQSASKRVNTALRHIEGTRDEVVVYDCQMIKVCQLLSNSPAPHMTENGQSTSFGVMIFFLIYWWPNSKLFDNTVLNIMCDTN